MKKFQAILFPVTDITNVTKGKSIRNQPFQHLQCETKVTGFLASLCRICVLFMQYMRGSK